MKNSILVGSDGSAAAAAALRWAAAEARLRDVPLKIVHASRLLEPGHGFDEADLTRLQDERGLALAVLRADTLRENPGLEVETVTAAGEPGAVLDALSEEAGLLVVGNRGVAGFEGLLLGSVSLHVAAHAHCPTVIMPHEADHDLAGPVLVGVDERHPDNETLAFAYAEADRRGVPLIALRAVALGSPRQRGGEVMELSEALAGWTSKYPDLTVDRRIVEDGAAQAIVHASGEASLVVVGARRRDHRIGMALGRVTHAVLHDARCPIAIVPDH